MIIGSRAFWWVAPYAAWMIIMAALPQNAVCYAIRGVITAFVLIGSALRLDRGELWDCKSRPLVAVLVGLFAGLAVFFIWISPETFLGMGQKPLVKSPYSPEEAGLTLTLVKLAASSFVIPIAEEMFFRKWLVDFAGFWWMVLIFAVEHSDRWHVGAITGVVYGLIARKYGILSAMVAHVVTNFILGAHVIINDEWRFW